MEEAAESSGISDVKDQSEVPTWFNLTTKVALALAIIRTTPIGRSAKAYTEYLAKRVSGHEFNWKSKVEELEAEVLWLRQQLFLNKIQSANASERVEKGDISTGASSHEENTHTAKHLHQLEDDSGCDTCNEERMNLVDVIQEVQSWHMKYVKAFQIEAEEHIEQREKMSEKEIISIYTTRSKKALEVEV
ncbi:hypothetical protein NDU88_003763 [Pleurodeles waltl]|uniref:Uncharacterized protein n=1 Tax=Pleurodeles waltl TaxID=8319 RepID=A0AAV7REU5_PLEWA|nr:hypothetical protein NDU88_003763 [Pleurodeles waltl]